jgi:hypothetical protein
MTAIGEAAIPPRRWSMPWRADAAAKTIVAMVRGRLTVTRSESFDICVSVSKLYYGM